MHPVVAVAAGCLINGRGEVLIAERPAGKIAAGKWEFPGGKIEPGETARHALERELREELGVAIGAARPLIRVRHAYSERTVVLDTWLVTEFSGEPHPHEQQALAWVRPEDMRGWDLLAADKPIVAALQLPSDYVFTPPYADERRVRDGLTCLPHGALLRLRWPALSDVDYARLAALIIPAARAAGLRVTLDRSIEMATQLGADGWHATSTTLASKSLALRDNYSGFRIASCHDAVELARAKALDFDAAVLGPVQVTATHPDRVPLGWGVFEKLASDSALPVFAIGGVGLKHAEAFAHYAQGTAGISSYWPS